MRLGSAIDVFDCDQDIWVPIRSNVAYVKSAWHLHLVLGLQVNSVYVFGD